MPATLLFRLDTLGMNPFLGPDLRPDDVASLLAEARARTLLLTAGLSSDDLRRQHDPLMSPIVWDLGHIAHFEEVWLLEMLAGGDHGSEGLRGIYNPFENPRAVRDGLPLPSLAECRDYLGSVRRAVLDGLDAREPAPDDRLLHDGFVYRMVLQHEYQHNETILQTLQLKQGAPWEAPRGVAAPEPAPGAPEPGAMVRVAGGRIDVGTDDRSAAYDNERPRHETEVAPFAIDVHPVTNGQYLAFMEAGGYQDPDPWSEGGRAWLADTDVSAPKHWQETGTGWKVRRFDRTGDVDLLEPVCHVGFWEAEAYARWAGKRLPTEFEWEVAAAWDAGAGRSRVYPWGDQPPDQRRANVDAQLFRPAPVGSYPLGVSSAGCWGMLGDVWEWTSSDFRPYPGYETFPYPEYSEAFFGDEYRVLRGASWATRPGATRATFRNWDYPIRRQIFAGFRCASDD